MARRVAQNETFHGTAAGQAPNIAGLKARFDLSERQAQCAALLRMGSPPQGVAEVLGISASTLETHLAGLRRVFQVPTTERLRAALCSLIPDAELDAFHCWPARTNSLSSSIASDPVFAARLRTSISVEQALGAFQAELVDIGVKHLYYCYLPHSVQGFMRGDILDVFLAPAAIQQAFRANNGLIGQPLAEVLLNAPTDVPVAPLDPDTDSESLGAFYTACRDFGATHLMVLGFPSGPGFVAMALTVAASVADVASQIADEAEAIRSGAMALHASLLTNGTLAARVRLTIRERDALSALALGKRAVDAAQQMNVSERAFAKLTASARAKLHARTNAEAVGKAVLINALVFL